MNMNEVIARINELAKKNKTEGLTPEELGELLQTLMDKFTFQGVEQSWLKVCYYYDSLK